jgi:hypothetical protein
LDAEIVRIQLGAGRAFASMFSNFLGKFAEVKEMDRRPQKTSAIVLYSVVSCHT